MNQPSVNLAVISAGVSDPSSTRLLADRIAQKSIDALREDGIDATASIIELGPLAVDIARSLVAGHPDPAVRQAIERLAVVLRSGVSTKIADRNWAGYQHRFGGNATRAERGIDDVYFDSDLMRLAAGGS